MDSIIGTVVTAKVTDENDEAYFVQIDGQTLWVDKTEPEKPLHIGGLYEGFVYENEDHHLQMTRFVPEISFDHFVWGTVVRTRHDLGVFVDVGLPNKDLVVSLDELPTISQLWPKKDDRLYVKLARDNKQRLWATLAELTDFEAIAKPYDRVQVKNTDTMATVFRLKMAGTSVITDDNHLGFVHPSEREQEPRMGQHVKARVIGFLRDGELNLSLKPRGYEEIGDDAQMLLAALQHQADHALPFWDKSDPDDIRNYFGISKSQFKRAVGNLLKQRLISQQPGEIKLLENADEQADD
ncbi:S1-like domain-containing RNA-binding protein [Lactiplantibacillus plantarum]|uniref:CvfB family protein n=1 Tax=Lactiplantibacillus plantarum TaxID=1590 RepID=UPI001F4BE165|nr:S1-like domain-containing RNA-binding protein [Lactiplantibacillus plantarum]MCK3676930.1 S1-like domain-containing RNA-binding protein [Lactiplantibacillus plantarum]UNB86198.1 S1-like domain-containing RNA-binding protein [Lactiplantibacillus plantarum]WQC49647.1 S1-like domain-containing RNA-binding protein [Lactiplantibacillus plantarum]WQG55504.1 S1-like domain-containing RNA-binding protein [Lactiplantibacillus plantarum]